MHRILLGTVLLIPVAANGDELDDALQIIQTAAVDGSNHEQVAAAWRVAAGASVDDLPRVLSAMPDDNPQAQNWIRNAVDAAAERAIESGDGVPMELLRDYILDTNHPDRARRVAYEWLTMVDGSAAEQLLPDFLNDKNLELRYDAVAALIEAADAVAEEDQQRKLYQAAFEAARDTDQLSTCATALGELGVEVDIVEQMGFVTEWWVAGPFDNVDGVGFDAAYQPEEEIASPKSINTAAIYDGKYSEGLVAQWTVIESDSPQGMVDIADLYDNEKGAAAYVFADVKSEAQVAANIRYTTHCASKLWINGKLVAENHVYHAGGEGDQYIVPVTLNKGTNTIMLKTCQNEQTEPWAQSWEFALRVCDPLGGKLDGVEYGLAP